MKIVIFEIEPHEKAAFEVLRERHEILLVATRSTGFEHIDAAYCADRGIAISNVPRYGENTVAEHVFALLLTIRQRILEAVDPARSGPFSPQGLQGFDLEGKTLDVVGTGGIGRCVIRIALGFGMEAIASDMRPDETLARQLDFRYAPFDEVLATADIVTLHVPATPETHNLLSKREFALIKDGAVMVNTARKSLIDVLPEEPAIREEAELVGSTFCERHDLRDHVLLRMPNVVITPHSALNTREALKGILDTIVANITAFADGSSQNIVAGSPHGALPSG